VCGRAPRGQGSEYETCEARIDLSYLLCLHGSQSKGIQQKLIESGKWDSRSLQQYKYFWSNITKFKNNLITSEAPGQNFITKAHEDLKKIKLGLRRAGITQSKKYMKRLKDRLKTLANFALVHKQPNLLAENRLALALENFGFLPMLKSSKLFYKGFQKDIALFKDKSNQITLGPKAGATNLCKDREYLKKKDLQRDQGHRLKAGEGGVNPFAPLRKDLKQIFQAKKELLKDLISNLRLFRKLKLNFHLNKSKFEEKLLYRLKNLIIQYYNKKVEFNFVNLKSLIFNSDLFTYILTLKLKKEKGKPRIIRLMKFILNKAKMPVIRLKKLHKNWEYELAPGGKNIKLRLLNNNKSLETKLSIILGRNYTSSPLRQARTGFEENRTLIRAQAPPSINVSEGLREGVIREGQFSLACVETSPSQSAGTGFQKINFLERSLSKLLNMLYFNASAIYGGEAPLPLPLAYKIKSLGMQSMNSLLRKGKAHIKSMRNVVRTSSARFASKFITASEAANYLIRISWAKYKRTWSKTSAYALNYFIFNSINYKNMGGVRLEVSGRLSKRYRADRAIYKLRWKGGLKNIDSSVQGKSSVVFRGFRDSNVQYSWFKSKRRIGSFAVKGWLAGRYSTLAYNREDLTTSSSAASTHLAGGCLNPWVVTGLVDAEGSFIIKTRKSDKYRAGWKIEAVFAIGLHQKDLPLLKDIQAYFEGIGTIHEQGKGYVQYAVSSKKQLSVIIDHFNNYPLITQKRVDFELFQRAVEIMNKGGYNETLKVIEQIISIRASLNKGLTDKLKEAFPNTIPYPKDQELLIKNPEISHPHWVAGLQQVRVAFLLD